MSENMDFERAWQGKFSAALRRLADAAAWEAVMRGGEDLDSQSPPEEVINWTQSAIQRLEALVPEEKRRDILTRCACQYPPSSLIEPRRVYEETGDLEHVHRMLQEQFESLLRDTMHLDEPLALDIIRRGWGSAGVLHGRRIIATKIPKSGNLLEYMKETDPLRKRQLYCHCPRIRQALVMGVSIPATYCYCGAGFYRGIWEEILQARVEVEVLGSVLQGDEVCTIAILLPTGV